MAKKSFILYHDQKEVIDELDDEQAGKLLKAIYEYNVNQKEMLTGVLKLVFIPFKNSFDRDEEKWEDIINKRSEAGKRHTGNQYTRKSQKENGTNGTSVPKMEQNGTNGTVSVSVNGNVSDSVSESVSDNNIITPPTTPAEVFNFCLSIFPDCVESDLEKKCKKFFKHYEAKKWEGIYDWKSKIEEWVQDDIDKGNIKQKEKEKIDTEKIREDEEGSIYKLNSDGTRYYI